jgi:acyl-CoA synthetase (AMP-forming)/AMP-acid ligase II
MFIAELGHPEFKRFDLTSLRTGIMAGSPCPIEIVRRCVTEMNMREVTIAYGMTETSPVSTQLSPAVRPMIRALLEQKMPGHGLATFPPEILLPSPPSWP